MSLQVLVFSLLVLTTTVLSRSARIIGGQDANIVDFSSTAALIKVEDNICKCGGAIISSRDILTAAHCLYKYDDPIGELKFVVGATDLSTLFGTELTLEKVNIHPEFKVLQDHEVVHHISDIAIVRVKEKIIFSNTISKVNLPRRGIVNGNIAMLSGWGLTTYPSRTPSETLKKTWMKIWDLKSCKASKLVPMQRAQFCAFQKVGVGMCTGDGGNPLVTLNTVIGIASAFAPCATGFPDVYTDVYLHVSYIREFMIDE